MKTRKHRPEIISFELPINGRSYSVNASPYAIATGEKLYRISYNNGPVHIFGWDEGLHRYAETDNMVTAIPPVVEMAIAEKLNQYGSQMQHAA